jgi:hypothetical protein
VSPASGRQGRAALAPGTRLRVDTGQPSPEELAAVVIAVDAAEARPPARRVGAGGDDRPAWQRAARLEAAGVGRLATPSDLWRRPVPRGDGG